MTGDSYIVSLYGLDGKREHWMPGNHRTGQGPREKRPFSSEEAALAFVTKNSRPNSTVYQCGVCGFWHTASPKRQ